MTPLSNTSEPAPVSEVPAIFTRTYTRDSFIFVDLLNNVEYSYGDIIYLNTEERQISRKRPKWTLHLKLYAPDRALPGGVKAAIKAAQVLGPTVQIPKLYQDIQLSYFGNAAKEHLIKTNWNPAPYFKEDKKPEPWAALKEIIGMGAFAFFNKLYYDGSPIEMGAWFVAMFNEHGHQYDIARRMYRLMKDEGIAFPFDLPNIWRKAIDLVIHVDWDTRMIIDATKPAPAKPVEVKPAPEKKSSENPVEQLPPSPAMGDQGSVPPASSSQPGNSELIQQSEPADPAVFNAPAPVAPDVHEAELDAAILDGLDDGLDAEPAIAAVPQDNNP